MEQTCDSISCILARNEFYQKNYRRIVIINLFLFLVICLLVGFLYYQNNGFAIPKYFPTTSDGIAINSPPNDVNHLTLDKLHFNAEGVLVECPEIHASNLDLQATDSNEHAIINFWVTKAIISIFELDFVNFRVVLQDVRQYFTAKGYEKFSDALRDSKNLDSIKKGKRVAYAVLNGKVIVTEVGIIEEHMVWNASVPVVVTYESDKEEILTQTLLAEVKIARVSTLQSPFYGLAIYQINFKVD